MPRLPVELLATIVKYAPTNILPRLLLVSREAYSTTLPILYASVPNMSKRCTIQCLLTLATKPEIACLVRSFSFFSPFYHALQAFHFLFTRALGNMTSLHKLLLHPNVTISNVLIQVPCQLMELVYLSSPSDSRRISQFLRTQPTIEKLTLICSPNDLDTLTSDTPCTQRLECDYKSDAKTSSRPTITPFSA
ncbi:unnamed protein product [Rhizoctonia solani]|uniref:F-box domain-containing protein n=1 Tax=Rhizoctonia solani TaxID=456999 RepID=A0A8H3E745_9AGAM|nr:unnamed protein product [Rhizoctonia solani]